ncbi:MAG: alpha/beta fold hydrolase [Gammaproteobacteria bacterium]
MRHFLLAALILLVPSIALAASPPTAAKGAGDTCQKISTAFLRNLQNGGFKAATAQFDSKMKAALSPQSLEKLWNNELPEKFGAFESATKPKTIHLGVATNILTPLQFAHDRQIMVVSCDAKHEIQGLFFQPANVPRPTTSQAPSSATVWITQAAVGAKTLPITVQRKGFVLKGVLDLPAGKGPFGVVGIIPGSGPVDINGNAGPVQYGMYKKLAAALVKAGWAAARIAKRGIPPSTGDANHIVFKDQVADNLAIVKALGKNPRINPERIVVAGHSIGGLIAPKLATETTLAGLILLEAPGESMKKIIMAQALRQQKLAGASATELAAAKAHITKLNSLVTKAPPGKTVASGAESSIFARIFAHSPDAVQLFKSWYAQDPLETARKVNVPVLVVQGGKDTQSFPGNGKRLAKALPHGKLLYLPQMDHDLTLEQEGTGKGATLAPRLTAGIVHWLKSLP